MFGKKKTPTPAPKPQRCKPEHRFKICVTEQFDYLHNPTGWKFRVWDYGEEPHYYEPYYEGMGYWQAEDYQGPYDAKEEKWTQCPDEATARKEAEELVERIKKRTASKPVCIGID